MIKTVSAQVVLVTRDVAREMMRGDRYGKQRGLNLRRVEMYERDMRNGDFLPSTPIDFVTLEGKTFLTNGQHRLQAVINSGVEIEFIRIDHVVDTEEELDRMYYNTDMGMPRTIGQMYRALDADGGIGVPTSIAMRAGNAVNFIKSGWVGAKRVGLTKNEILRLLLSEYREPLINYRNVTMTRVGGIYSSMWRSPVCALGLETYRWAKDDNAFASVQNFWLGVVDDSGLSASDPRKAAREYLLTTTLGDDSRMQRVTRAHNARYMIACYNAHREGRVLNAQSKTGAIKIFNENAPVVIYGTPWDGTKTS